jgi:hypothetical protein
MERVKDDVTKSKSGIISELKSQFEHEASYFSQLAARLEVSIYIIKDLDLFDNEQFPANDASTRYYHDSEMSPQPVSSQDAAKHWSADLSGEKTSTMIEDTMNKLDHVQIDEDSSFTIMKDCCMTMHFLCVWMSADNTAHTHALINKIEALGLLVNAKAHLLLGYWTAKMEEKWKNQKGGGAGQTKKYKARIVALQEAILKNVRAYVDEAGIDVLEIDKSKFDSLCREVFEVTADVSFPTKQKYLKEVQARINKKINLTKK